MHLLNMQNSSDNAVMSYGRKDNHVNVMDYGMLKTSFKSSMTSGAFILKTL